MCAVRLEVLVLGPACGGTGNCHVKVSKCFQASIYRPKSINVKPLENLMVLLKHSTEKLVDLHQYVKGVPSDTILAHSYGRNWISVHHMRALTTWSLPPVLQNYTHVPFLPMSCILLHSIIWVISWLSKVWNYTSDLQWDCNSIISAFSYKLRPFHFSLHYFSSSSSVSCSHTDSHRTVYFPLELPRLHSNASFSLFFLSVLYMTIPSKAHCHTSFERRIFSVPASMLLPSSYTSLRLL